MGKAKDFFEISKFTAALAELVDSLPSESEKRELDANFARIVGFLSELRVRLSSLPTREDAESVRRSLRAIDDLAARSGTDAGLRAVLGLKSPTVPRKSVLLNEHDTARAQSQVTELESQSIDQMRQALSDENRYSARDLYAIARHMGMRTREKAGRETLVHQIATRISNFRGYQDLGEGGNSSPETGQHVPSDNGKSEE